MKKKITQQHQTPNNKPNQPNQPGESEKPNHQSTEINKPKTKDDDHANDTISEKTGLKKVLNEIFEMPNIVMKALGADSSSQKFGAAIIEKLGFDNGKKWVNLYLAINELKKPISSAEGQDEKAVIAAVKPVLKDSILPALSIVEKEIPNYSGLIEALNKLVSSNGDEELQSAYELAHREVVKTKESWLHGII